MYALNSFTLSRPLYIRNGKIAPLFQSFLGGMLFIKSDLLFHSYVWLVRLYLSSHITPKIILNITKKKSYKRCWYISTLFEVLIICFIFSVAKVPSSSSINRKHIALLLFTFYKIFRLAIPRCLDENKK